MILWGDKVKDRRDRGICCVLAILVLFSGMCLELARTDSFFASVKNPSSAAYVSSLEGNMTNCEFSTAEMSGVRGTEYTTGSIRRVGERSMLRLTLLLFFVRFILTKVSNMRVAVETAGAPETRYAEALLHYIHSQDGKK